MSNNEEIMVSVFCTCYNHENYIRDCLDGFIMQETKFKFEVLVHDDASTDNSMNIIKEYEKKYPDIIKPIYQKENQYSKGIDILTEILPKFAKGKYIAFCEGDDFWTDRHKLQRQFEALEDNPNCSICLHKVRCCTENGKLINKEFPTWDLKRRYNLDHTSILNENVVRKLFWTPWKYPFHTSSYFIKKEVFKTDLGYSKDIGLLRKSLLYGDFYYMYYDMSKYRVDSKNSWNDRMKNKSLSWDKEKEWRIQQDHKYDLFTNNKYHNDILISNYILASEICDNSIKRSVKEKYKLKLRFLFCQDLIEDIKIIHLLLRYVFLPFLHNKFPLLYSFYRKIIRKKYV